MPIPAPWHERLEGSARRRRELGRERQILGPRGLDFTSNDYLGLRRDPRLAQAAAEAAREFGAGSGAARLLRGSTELHDRLEAALAAWKGQPSALLLNTGYQANATLLPALTQAGDAIFSDALNHASLIDGCRMARDRGVQVEVYGHLDVEDLETRLRAWRARAAPGALALVATDGIFSMDGDGANLPALLDVCRRHEALLMVDEAHASGLLGPEGEGLAAHQGIAGEVPLVMGTLGKALGCSGAFVACPAPLREHLVNACRGFIFSTALPPPTVGAALRALEVARTERWRAQRALEGAERIREALGLPPHPSAIVPVLVGEEGRALARARALQDRGFDVRAVRPPTVPPGTALLRIPTGAHLESADIDALIRALKDTE